MLAARLDAGHRALRRRRHAVRLLEVARVRHDVVLRVLVAVRALVDVDFAMLAREAGVAGASVVVQRVVAAAAVLAVGVAGLVVAVVAVQAERSALAGGARLLARPLAVLAVHSVQRVTADNRGVDVVAAEGVAADNAGAAVGAGVALAGGDAPAVAAVAVDVALAGARDVPSEERAGILLHRGAAFAGVAHAGGAADGGVRGD